MFELFNILAACGPFNKDEFEVVSYAYKAILFATPAVVLALCTADIAKAVIAQDDNALKKAQGAALKRLIAGVIVFFVPIIINLFLGLNYTVKDYYGNESKFDLGKKCVNQLKK